MQRVWIILDSMKVEEMPDLQVQPMRVLVLLNPACPCWEFAGNFQENPPPQPDMDKKPQKSKGIRGMEKGENS